MIVGNVCLHPTLERSPPHLSLSAERAPCTDPIRAVGANSHTPPKDQNTRENATKGKANTTGKANIILGWAQGLGSQMANLAFPASQRERRLTEVNKISIIILDGVREKHGASNLIFLCVSVPLSVCPRVRWSKFVTTYLVYEIGFKKSKKNFQKKFPILEMPFSKLVPLVFNLVHY